MTKTILFLSTLSLTATLAGAALAESNRTFLQKALEGDNSEMTLGQLAQQRGASPGVRDFGRMLHDDHDAAKAKALPVAQRHGLTDTTDMTPEARAEARKLQRLSGRAFDREFIRYMIGDHRKDIAEFQKQARTGDRATAELARDTLPDLRKHLRTAEQLAPR